MTNTLKDTLTDRQPHRLVRRQTHCYETWIRRAHSQGHRQTQRF